MNTSSSAYLSIASPTIGNMLGNLAFRYAWGGVALVVGVIVYISTKLQDPYAKIPAVGRTGAISSYIDAIRLMREANILLQEGYEKYKPGIFRFPDLYGWKVVVCGKKLIDDICKAPDDVLSFDAASIETFAGDYLIGPEFTSDLYHTQVLQSQLTKNVQKMLPLMRDEFVSCFDEHIPITTEWSSVRVLDALMKIVCRTTNRVFVGAPACRDPEFLRLNIEFTINVIIRAQIINMFPVFLRPLAGFIFNYIPNAVRIGSKHLGPIIEDRLRNIDEFGADYPGKPNDLLSWLIEARGKHRRSVQDLTLRILSVNFAAIHTTSMTLTHTLLHLAARPEYIKPIREEVEVIIAKNGWNKVSISRMRKLDSFLKECQRYDGIVGTTLNRIALKDFTFSDGTVIPKGTHVSALALSIHRDEEYYHDGNTFNGFRFSDMREEAGEELKNQMVATSPSYIPFGHGKHACPGRFFGANEMKAMLGHLLLTYDIKMENEGVRPPSQWFMTACTPDRNAEVLFRKRRT